MSDKVDVNMDLGDASLDMDVNVDTGDSIKSIEKLIKKWNELDAEISKLDFNNAEAVKFRDSLEVIQDSLSNLYRTAAGNRGIANNIIDINEINNQIEKLERLNELLNLPNKYNEISSYNKVKATDIMFTDSIGYNNNVSKEISNKARESLNINNNAVSDLITEKSEKELKDTIIAIENIEKAIKDCKFDINSEDDLAQLKIYNAQLDNVKKNLNQMSTVGGTDEFNRDLVLAIKNADKLEKEMKQVANVNRTTGKSFDTVGASMNRLDGMVQRLAMSVAGLFAAGQVIDAIGGRAIKVEQLTVAFEVLTGSIEKTNKLMVELQSLADKSSLEMPDVATSSKMLMASGADINEIPKLLRQIGDLTMGDTEAFKGASRALSDMIGKQKVMAEEMKQFQNFGIPIRAELAKTLGVTSLELDSLLRRGEVTTETLFATMNRLTGSGGRFNNMLERQSKTVYGMFTTVKDTVSGLGVEATSEAYKQVGDYLENLLEKINKFKETEDGKEFMSDVGNLTERFVGLLTQGIEKIWESKDAIIGIFKLIVSLLELTVEHSEALLALWIGGKLVGGAKSFSKALSSGYEILNKMVTGSMVVGDGLGISVANANKLNSALITMSKIAVPVLVGGALAKGTYDAGSDLVDKTKNIFRSEDEKYENALGYVKSDEFNGEISKDTFMQYSNISGELNTLLNNGMKALETITSNTATEDDKNEANAKLIDIQDALRPNIETIAKELPTFKQGLFTVFSTSTNKDDIRNILGDSAYTEFEKGNSQFTKVVLDISGRMQGITDGLFNRGNLDFRLSDENKFKVIEVASLTANVLKTDELNSNRVDYIKDIQKEIENIEKSVTSGIEKANVYKSDISSVKSVLDTYKSGGEISSEVLSALLNDSSTYEFANAIIGGKDVKEVETIANNTITSLSGLLNAVSGIFTKARNDLATIEIRSKTGNVYGDVKTEIDSALSLASNAGKVVDYQATKTNNTPTQSGTSKYDKYLKTLEQEVSLGKLTELQYLNRLKSAQKLASTSDERLDIERQIYQQQMAVYEKEKEQIQYKADMKMTNGDTLDELSLNANIYDEQYKQLRGYYEKVKSTANIGNNDRVNMMQELEKELKDLANEGKRARVAIVEKELGDIANKYSQMQSSLSANKSYSESWIELNSFTEALNLQQQLAAKKRVFDRDEKNTLEQLKGIEEQIAIIVKDRNLTDIQKNEKLSQLEIDRLALYQNQKQVQLNHMKELADVYKSTMTEAIESVYNKEIGEIDRVAKARRRKQEDEDMASKEKELKQRIEMLSGASTLDGKKQLDDAKKQLEDFRKELSNKEFDRNAEDKKEQLSKEREDALKEIEVQSLAFGKSGGTEMQLAFLNGLDEHFKNMGKEFGSGLDALLSKFQSNLTNVNTHISNKSITDGRNYTVNVNTNNPNSVNTGKVLLDLNTLNSYGY